MQLQPPCVFALSFATCLSPQDRHAGGPAICGAKAYPMLSGAGFVLLTQPA